MNLIVKNQYFHAEGEHQSALMKPIILLILMQHQKTCTIGTILKSLTHLLVKFESSSFTFYAKVESVLENAAVGKDISTKDIKEIVQHFKEDLVESDLLTELKMVKNVYCEKSFAYKEFKEKVILYKSIFPQTSRLLQLLLVMPATSATAERSFSSLRHVKTYLCTTMKQERLNHLMMIYIHQDRKIDIEEAMDKFVLFNDERKRVFGKPQ